MASSGEKSTELTEGTLRSAIGGPLYETLRAETLTMGFNKVHEN